MTTPVILTTFYFFRVVVYTAIITAIRLTAFIDLRIFYTMFQKQDTIFGLQRTDFKNSFAKKFRLYTIILYKTFEFCTNRKPVLLWRKLYLAVYNYHVLVWAPRIPFAFCRKTCNKSWQVWLLFSVNLIFSRFGIIQQRYRQQKTTDRQTDDILWQYVYKYSPTIQCNCILQRLAKMQQEPNIMYNCLVIAHYTVFSSYTVYSVQLTAFMDGCNTSVLSLMESSCSAS